MSIENHWNRTKLYYSCAPTKLIINNNCLGVTSYYGNARFYKIDNTIYSFRQHREYLYIRSVKPHQLLEPEWILNNPIDVNIVNWE